MWMRGFGQRRIAVSVNGIPQNDPEEFNVFWINFFDLQGVIDDIQVQRGAGSSHYGPAAIGGTIDIGPLPIVRGDSTQLTQLLQNLVHNAIKYRHDDRAPHIAITAEDTDDGWVISVADNGIGVDAAQHGRIFELFRRGHPGYSGVGLGLAICQRIIERHDGSIWVDSSPGEGSTFSFSLPSREDRV